MDVTWATGLGWPNEENDYKYESSTRIFEAYSKIFGGICAKDTEPIWIYIPDDYEEDVDD